MGFVQVTQLTSLRLLHRTSPLERLDAPTYRCAVGYEEVLVVAKDLGIPLAELIWDLGE